MSGSTQYEKAVALYYEGKYAEAVPIMDQVVQKLRDKKQLNTPAGCERLTWAANTRNRAGDVDGAIKLHEECLKVRYGMNDVGRPYADTLFRLGVAYCESGKFDLALKHLLDCKALEEKLGQSHEVAFSASSSTLNYLCRAFCETGEPEKGAMMSLNARNIQEKLNKTGGTPFLTTLTGLGLAYFDAKNTAAGAAIASEVKLMAALLCKVQVKELLKGMMTTKELPAGNLQRVALLLAADALGKNDKRDAMQFLEACKRLGKSSLKTDVARQYEKYLALANQTQVLFFVKSFSCCVFFSHNQSLTLTR